MDKIAKELVKIARDLVGGRPITWNEIKRIIQSKYKENYDDFGDDDLDAPKAYLKYAGMSKRGAKKAIGVWYYHERSGKYEVAAEIWMDKEGVIYISDGFDDIWPNESWPILDKNRFERVLDNGIDSIKQG